MKRLEFHPEAQAEFEWAARFFEEKAAGLGVDFVRVVERLARRVLDFPNSGQAFGPRLRRMLVPRFPYGLLYSVEDDRIFVVAVMHLHRQPGYWRPRT